MTSSFIGRVSASDRLDLKKGDYFIWRVIAIGDDPTESCELFIASKDRPSGRAVVSISYDGREE